MAAQKNSSYRRTRWLVLVILITSLHWSSTTTFADTPKKGIKVLETERLKKKGDEARKKVRPKTIRVKAKRKRQIQTAIDDNIEEQIETLNMLIDSADDEDPDLPKYLLTLGDVYWDKADTFYDQAYDIILEKEIYDAAEAGNTSLAEQGRTKQKSLLDGEKRWRGRAIQVYRSIETRFGAYGDLDMVFYYLGYQLMQLNRKEQAYVYFRKILERFPTSRYIADALFHIGDYFFDQNKFDLALKFYEKVEEFPRSVAYAMSLHKQGWCFYNMGDYGESLKRFLRVIVYSSSEEAKSLPFRLELEQEARQDLVRAYAAVGTPERSLRFFQKIAPDIKFQLTEDLARMFFSEGEWRKSATVYKLLLKNYRNSPNEILYWLGIAENAYHEGKQTPVVNNIRGLMQGYRDLIGRVDEGKRKEVEDRLEGLIKTAATNYHKEAEKYRDKDTIRTTSYLYEAYLVLFPNARDSYEVTWNLAVLNEQIGEWETAARMYEEVIRRRPEGEHAADAAKAILLAYYNAVEGEERAEKDTAEINLDPIPYTEQHQKVIKAAARYIKVAKGKDPEVSKAHYLLSKIAYNFNHFDDALSSLRAILSDFPDDPLVIPAARMILSCFNLQRDVENLNAYADRFALDERLNKGSLKVLISKIRNQAGFNKCFQYEKSKEYVRIAQCFLKYVRDFPKTDLKARAFFYAAAAFNRAKLVERALQTLGDLYNEMPNDPLAPTAIYSIAELYRSIAVYSEAARFYEAYAAEHPRHKYVKKALQRAYIFRRALQEQKKAIKVSRRYRKMFPNDESRFQLALEEGQLLRDSKNTRKAIATFKRLLKRPPKGMPDDILLRVRLELGRTLQKGNKRAKAQARKVFEANVAAYEGLPEDRRRKLSDKGTAAVAESHFLIGEGLLRDMKAVEFKGRTKQIIAALGTKLTLIKDANTVFVRVIDYGQRNWAIAGVARIGQAYEALAKDILNAPVPRSLRGDAADIYRQDLVSKSEPIRANSIKMYRKALDMAISNRWFNTYTQDAIQALSRLDYSFSFLKEYGVRVDQVRLSGQMNGIGSFTEAEDAGLTAPEEEGDGADKGGTR